MKEKIIFFIDDDKIILDLLEYTFQNRDGIQVFTFTTGEEAIKNLSKKPDIIILDYCFHKMGKDTMSGLEALNKIREQDPLIPVIMLTNMTDPELIKQFESAGAYKYVCKDSYFIDTLMQTIDTVFTSINAGN